MIRIVSWLILSVFILLSVFSCTTTPEVSEQNVTRIIKNLSSDSLKGRHAFSPEIRIAANLISAEFEAIGLSPLPGEDNFKQDFKIYTIRPDSVSFTVNGKALDEDYYFGLLNSESFSWSEDEVQIRTIGEEDDFRKVFRELSDDDNPSLIVVDKAHKKWFYRYQSYFSGRNRTLELDSEPNDIVILHTAKVTSFDINFQNKISVEELWNVAGMIEGERSDEIVLFSAHYDHIGVLNPFGQDSIANGANDNATGVSAVIELGRYYRNKAKPKRTIYFIGFTAEESGGFGSSYFSDHINPEHIVAMLNIEMIGKPPIDGAGNAWITGFEYSSLGEILQTSIKDSSYVFYPDPYPRQNLFYRSDNTVFAKQGIPAHTISTTPIDVDHDYHHVSDEFQTVHIPHTVKTIRAIAKASETIISGQETPSRIQPDSLEQ